MTQSTPLPALVALWLALLLAGCATRSPDDPEYGAPPDLAEASVAFGRSVKNGASAMGRGMGTAYQGVRHGFAEPESDADFGPYPKDYAVLVKKHFMRVLRYSDDASFRFGRPQKGYLSKGLLRGGGIAWQGWLVDVDVETRQSLTGHRKTRPYVVRLRDGEVVDVHTDDTLLKRVTAAR